MSCNLTGAIIAVTVFSRYNPHMSRDTSATERIGIVAWHLAEGRPLTTSEAAHLVGIGHRGAWAMLGKLSRVLPIVQVDGVWQLADGCPGAMPKRQIGDTAAHPR